MRPQYSITSQPCGEPLTIAQASEHLRVDSVDDMSYIDGLISVAREYVDSVTGRVSGVTSFRLIAESWESIAQSAWCIPVYRTPLISVASIKYYAPDASALTTMNSANYRVITAAEPGLIQIIDDVPAVDDRPDAIEILFSAGTDNASPVHRHAVKMLVAHLYENRLPIAFASCNQIPMTLQTLIENIKLGGWIG